MRWKCSCCGNTMTTNSGKPLISGCKASKDKKHKWVKV